jgi:hypothetical protein
MAYWDFHLNPLKNVTLLEHFVQRPTLKYTQLMHFPWDKRPEYHMQTNHT